MVTKSPSSQQRKTRERPEKNSKPKSRKETGTLSAVNLQREKDTQKELQEAQKDMSNAKINGLIGQRMIRFH